MPSFNPLDLFSSPEVQDPDKSDYHLGGESDYALRTSQGREAMGNIAQDREGAQIGQDEIEASRANQLQTRGDMRSFGSTLDSIIAGTGPSAASKQLQQGQDAAMAQSLALARSGRGAGGGAGALRAAQVQNAATNQQTNQAAAIARSQEALGAVNAKQDLLTNQRAMDLQAQGLDAQTAIAQAQLEAQQRGLNDRMQLGLIGAGDNLLLGQAGAYGQYNATRQQGQSANAAADAQRDAALIGTASSLGGAAIKSDVRAKKNAVPLESSFGRGEGKTLNPLALLDRGGWIKENVAGPFRRAVDSQIQGPPTATREPLGERTEVFDPGSAIEAERAKQAWLASNSGAARDAGVEQVGAMDALAKEQAKTRALEARVFGRGSRADAAVDAAPELARGIPPTTSDERSKQRVFELETALAMATGGNDPTLRSLAQKAEHARAAAAHQVGGVITGRDAPGVEDMAGEVYSETGESLGRDTVSSAVDEVAKIPSYSYEYREPWAERYGRETQVGPMADDLEKSPLTAASVETGADGYKAVDTDRLSLNNTAMLSEVAREVADIRKQLGGKTTSDPRAKKRRKKMGGY